MLQTFPYPENLEGNQGIQLLPYQLFTRVIPVAESGRLINGRLPVRKMQLQLHRFSDPLILFQENNQLPWKK
ncbi:hypothetical protein D3C75_1174950 [compost metagenome]